MKKTYFAPTQKVFAISLNKAILLSASDHQPDVDNSDNEFTKEEKDFSSDKNLWDAEW